VYMILNSGFNSLLNVLLYVTQYDLTLHICFNFLEILTGHPDTNFVNVQQTVYISCLGPNLDNFMNVASDCVCHYLIMIR
jgi:hypothetical protein